MYILVAAATDAEIKPFVERQADFTGKLPVEVKVLITGVGSLAATFSLTSSLLQRKPDLVVQAGIAGSFDATLLPGTVVVVGDEVLGRIEKDATGVPQRASRRGPSLST